MLEKVQNEKVLFLDIETVPAVPGYKDFSPEFQELWDKKSIRERDEDQTAEDVFQRAGIYAEFGKIVCISVGMMFKKEGARWFRVKSFYGDDEKALLVDFAEMLNKFSSSSGHYICGHNIKEFDIPYIARRMLVNGIKLPEIIDVAGLKPWEVMFLDTLQLWKFGDFKAYTSLNLLTQLFNIPTPKDDIDGSEVAAVYYKEKDIERIVRYCEKDVLAVAQLYLRFKGAELIPEEHLEHADA